MAKTITLKKMTISNLIIHNVIKKQHEKEVKSVIRKTEIKVEDKHNKFLDRILKIYYGKSNPSYGVFDSNSTSYPYQKMLKDFVDTKTTFKAFSTQAVEHFVTKIKDEVNATGGFFLMVAFKSKDIDFIATIMLNNTTNYDIDESNLDINEKLTLDIDKVDVANIINLKKWEQKENTYLSFTKGRKNISDYFVNFIGCSKITDAKHYSQNLKVAFSDYLQHKGYADEEKAMYKISAYAYLKGASSSRQEVSLDGFVHSVFPEDHREAKRFLSRRKYEVTSSFRCDIQTYRDYQYIFYKSKDLNFQFSRTLLDQNILVYDHKKKHLTITKLDETVIKQIEEGAE